MNKPQDVAEPGQFVRVERFTLYPAIDVTVPAKEMSTSLQKMFARLKLEGKATVTVSVASPPAPLPQPVVSRLLFMVNAIVWLEVADGRESERVSEREVTCTPGVF